MNSAVVPPAAPSTLTGDVSALLYRFRHGLLLLLLVMPVLLPLLRPGFYLSDDGTFHVYRTAALARAWQQGVLHPRLFPEFGFGYGQAVLNFYAPLSYWPGALLSLLGTSPATALQAVIGLGFVASALAAYGYARSLWGPAAGLVAAVAYTYMPYHLVDAYVRGAVAEHLAFVFPPLILWAYARAWRGDHYLAPLLWSALAWAGLVLVHNLTALIMVPAALLYLLFLAAWTRRWGRLLPAAAALLLALGLTATYWLPVLVESSAVGLAIGPSQGFERHLLDPSQVLLLRPLYSYAREAGVPVTYPVSWLTVGLLLLSLVSLFWRWRQGRPLATWPVVAFHLTLAGLALLMTTTLSLSLWRPLTPVLGHLQYPWRFLLLVAVGLMGAAGALPVLWPQVRPGLWVGSITVLFVAVALASLPLQRLDLPAAEAWSPVRMWQEDAAMGQVGATWTGEFLPLAVSEQRWALGRPREGAQDGPALAPPAVTGLRRGYARLALSLDTPAPMPVRLQQFHQPGWQAWLDGEPVPTYASGEMGLVTVDVPAGRHQLAFRFCCTPARVAGAWISTAAALLWAALAWLAWRRQGGTAWLGVAAIALPILALVLGANALGVGQRTWAPRPVAAQLEDVALLVAAEADLAAGGQEAQVTLYWLALRETATDYKAFVHLLGQDGAVIAQHDGDPGAGFTPTTRWLPGEIVVDRHYLPLPADLPPGDYGLRAGLYQFDPLRNLTVTPPTADDRVDVGTLVVEMNDER